VSPSAPLLDGEGKKARDLELEPSVFAAEIKPHVVHETVRAEAAAARAGTRAAKSRGMVSGGRSKPWRQKGTGRARQGTTRAPQWTGGGVAFPPIPRSFDLKVNRKARRGALRAALTHHAQNESLGVVDPTSFGEAPSTRNAAALLAGWGNELPLLLVALPDEEVLAKSFRNLERVLVLEPSELEVSAVVWARSLLLSEGALARVQEVVR
jgi:large subunit ribosomal protein L4